MATLLRQCGKTISFGQIDLISYLNLSIYVYCLQISNQASSVPGLPSGCAQSPGAPVGYHRASLHISAVCDSQGMYQMAHMNIHTLFGGLVPTPNGNASSLP